MRPDDEKPDDEPTEDAPEPGADDQAGEHEAPPPATYAGRKRAEAGDGDEVEREGAAEKPEQPEATEPSEEDLRAGFTEEFDEIERSLAAELAGLDEPAPAEPEE
jgi:hypothetical protein